MDVIVSLLKVGAVLGLLVFTLRMIGRSRGLRAAGSGRSLNTGAGAVEVLDQARIGRTASIVTLRLGDKGVAIALTDQQITVIGEIDLTVAEPSDEPANHPTPSAAVWRQGLDVLRERTVRR
jgi:flagellar biogenesis protein FliO